MDGNNIPLYHISVFIRLLNPLYRKPGADIIPAEYAWQDIHIFCLFHNAVINRFRFHLLEFRFQYGILLFRTDGFPDLHQPLVRIRYMFFYICQDRRNLPHKHTAVPQIRFVRQILFRRFQIGFFHKPLHAVRASLTLVGIKLNVAVPGLRVIRGNTDRRQVFALFRHRARIPQHI